MWVQAGTSVTVGRIVAFWECQQSKQISIELRQYQRTDAHGTRWNSADAAVTFANPEHLVDAMAFADLGGDTVLVIPPCTAQL